MSKGYWITFYRKIINTDAMAAYGKLAVPAVESGGGKFLVRTMPEKFYEAGLKERVVVIEFPSLEQAVATFEGSAYQAAKKLLDGAVERDIRIVQGT
jgi:uncharacterized protein (DUF1330 family)